MEDIAHGLQAINAEVRASKEILQQLKNEVDAVYEVVGPSLMRQAQELRAARMTAVSEVRDSLAALRDVRRFFLESDYETEIARLERFVKVCREIQELKASGVFDAVCDAALKLAVDERRP
jgi:hypothetical protein